ncbi:MAG: ABC transporter substrate-binding protein [Actinomycetota bacterium]|nr:ABC transporter substrate-binding protein [Actinomycetota bacterium]
MRRLLTSTAAVVLLMGVVAACGDDDDDDTGAASAQSTGGGDAAGDGGDIEGSINVIHQRTDINEEIFEGVYKPAFEAAYPGVEVNFEAITDYEGEIPVRMNGGDYGDVLLIPNSVAPEQLPDFFEPLGTIDELGSDYRFVTEEAFGGEVYGLPITGNANGVLYNRAVFEEAGVETPLESPEAFLEALRAIDENTDAIPLYTNYAAGWPLTQWETNRGSISADEDYLNDLAFTDAPFAEGTDHHVIYQLMYDIAAAGLIEEDPTTTDWESSKALLGNGEIASMFLGSWAIVQFRDAADDPDDVGYMPFPSTTEGTYFSTVGGDYKFGIASNSDNKEAARAWIDWFVDESNYAVDQGGIAPRYDDPFPDELAEFEEIGVELLEQAPPPPDQAGLVDAIDQAGEVGLPDPPFKQEIIDAARGESGRTLDEIFAELNEKWAEGKVDAFEDFGLPLDGE